ncbi:MAG: Bug family tripartite tricarboxylate transporter substrate binding protein [Advenella sp.]
MALPVESNYPTQPIRLIVPFAAGGGTDVLARLLARYMGPHLGQTIVVENVTGAGGTIGATQVARAAADGYMLMIGTPSTIQVNPVIQKDLRYDPSKDFSPVSQFTDSPVALVINKNLPWTSVNDLVAAAKLKPGTINFGSAGKGSIEHLSAEMFEAQANIKMAHVPYRGTSQSLNDLRSGFIQVLFENLPPVLQLIQANEIKALAIGSANRSGFLPDLPTISESGVTGYESTSWLGLFAPSGTPQQIIKKIEKAAMAAAAEPAVIEAVRKLGAEAVGSNRADFRIFLDERRPVIEQVIKKAGMAIE